MRTLGSIEALAAAIRDEADTAIEARRQASDRAIDAVDPAAETMEAGRLDAERRARIAAAHRQARERRARDEWLGGKEALEARERWIDRVVAVARQRMTEWAPAVRRERLAALAVEALRRVPGAGGVLRLAPADVDLIDSDWVERIAARAGRVHVDVLGDGGVAPGGCLASTTDGAITFDNTLDARATRSERVWRAQLAALFDEPARPGEARSTGRGEPGT